MQRAQTTAQTRFVFPRLVAGHGCAFFPRLEVVVCFPASSIGYMFFFCRALIGLLCSVIGYIFLTKPPLYPSSLYRGCTAPSLYF